MVQYFHYKYQQMTKSSYLAHIYFQWDKNSYCCYYYYCYNLFDHSAGLVALKQSDFDFHNNLNYEWRY